MFPIKNIFFLTFVCINFAKVHLKWNELNNEIKIVVILCDCECGEKGTQNFKDMHTHHLLMVIMSRVSM